MVRGRGVFLGSLFVVSIFLYVAIWNEYAPDGESF